MLRLKTMCTFQIQIEIMNRPTSLLLALLAFFSIQSNVFAQTTFTAADNPKVVSKTLAFEATKTNLFTCGFSSVYIQSADLKELMNVKNCVGIRFYVGMQNPNQRFADVVAVAINANGKEIGDFLERKYHLAKPLDDHYPDDFEKMNLSSAKKAVYNLRDGVAGFKPFAAFLGTESLNSLINTADATGVRIYSAGSGSVRTMSFGAVSYANKEVKDISTNYLESLLPCPVDCGGDGYLLWNR